MEKNIGQRITSSADSKIPVLHHQVNNNNRFRSKLSKPLSGLSSRVRARIDSSYSSKKYDNDNNRRSTTNRTTSIAASISNISRRTSLDNGQIENVNNSNNNNNNNNNNISSSSSSSSRKKLSRPTTIFPNEYYSIASDRRQLYSTSDLLHLTVGCRVELINGKRGVVRYHGETNFGQGLWCGIELDGGQDYLDDDVIYFKCPDFKGLFVRTEDVLTIINEDDYRVKDYIDSEISDSGPHSLLGITSNVDEAIIKTSASSIDNELETDTIDKFKRSLSGSNYFDYLTISQFSTPATPNSSNNSESTWDRKSTGNNNYSQHSSSAGSLIHSNGYGKTFSAADGLLSSCCSLRRTSKHSSFEFEDSLGILTPDQMADFTANCSEGSKASCEDFTSLNLHDELPITITDDVNDNNNNRSIMRLDSTLETTIDSVETTQLTVVSRVDDSRVIDDYDDDIQFDHREEFLDELSETAIGQRSEDESNKSRDRQPTFDEDEQEANRTYSLEELPIDDAASDYDCLPNLVDEDGLDGLNGLNELSSTEVDQSTMRQHTSTTNAAIVTSVTSIGSWDNGYQGDGEFSRPTSRGAVDISPTVHNISAAAVKLRVTDAAATDSDFFTESDPDVYEDISSCMSGGDRRARVIDGTLYGSLKKSNNNTTTSATAVLVQSNVGTRDDSNETVSTNTTNTTNTANTTNISTVSEEMDSSGIYSDLGEKVDDRRNVIQQQEETFSDTSGNSSNKSISSQIKVNRYCNNTNNDRTKKFEDLSIVTNSNNSLNCNDNDNISNNNNNNNKVIDQYTDGNRRNNLVPSEGTFCKEPSSSTDEKYHHPKQQQQSCRNYKQTKKNAGKWDAIMSKIEKSRAEEKSRPARLREVKSKIVSSSSSSSNATFSRDSSLANRVHHRNCDARTLSPISVNVINARDDNRNRSANVNRRNDNANTSNNGNNVGCARKYSKILTAALSNSTRSLKEGYAFNNKLKSRKCRSRNGGGQDSPTTKSSLIATAPASLSQASSRNSSISDISDSLRQDLSHRSLPTSTQSCGPIRNVVEGSGVKKIKNNLSASPIINRSPIREVTRSSLNRSSAAVANNTVVNNVCSTTNSSPSSTLSTSQKSSHRLKSYENTVPSESKVINNGMKVPPIGKKASARRCTVTPLKDQNRAIGNGNIRDHTSSIKTVGKVQDRHVSTFEEEQQEDVHPDNNNVRQTKIKVRQPIPDAIRIVNNNNNNVSDTIDNDRNEALSAQLKYANRGMEAFAVIVRHLTQDPDVYSLPTIKNQLRHYQAEWKKTKQQLDEKTLNYRKLEDEFFTQKDNYEQQLQTMRSVHSNQLNTLNVKHKEDLDRCTFDYQIKLTDLEKDFRSHESSLRSEFQLELKAIEQKAETKLKTILNEAMRHVDRLKNENFTYQERIRLESKIKADQLEKRFVEKETKLLKELQLLRTDYEIQLQQLNSRLKENITLDESLSNDSNRQLMSDEPLSNDSNRQLVSNEPLSNDSDRQLVSNNEGNDAPFKSGRRSKITEISTSTLENYPDVDVFSSPPPSPTRISRRKESAETEMQTTLVPARSQFQNLEDEVCSLRDVLDLKCCEIQDLRKQNEKLKQQVEDLPYISQKLDSSIARIEDLKAQLQTKTNSEHGLLRENRKLLEVIQQETEKKKRLEFQNEELLWKLKRSSQVAKALATININKSHIATCNCTKDNLNSKSGSPESNNIELADKRIRRSKTDNDLKFIDASSSAAVKDAQESSSSQQKVLGVVEKSDSVSWVLEIEEPPIEVASRMLRRASSLRGMPSKKSSSGCSPSHDDVTSNHDSQHHLNRDHHHRRNNYTLPTRGKNRYRPRLNSKETTVTASTSVDIDDKNDSLTVKSNLDISNTLVTPRSPSSCSYSASSSISCNSSTSSSSTSSGKPIVGGMKFRSFSHSDVELSYSKKHRHLEEDIIADAVLQGLVDGNDSPDISAIFDFLPDSDVDDTTSSIGTATDRSDLRPDERIIDVYTNNDNDNNKFRNKRHRQTSSTFSDCTTNSDSSLELDDYKQCGTFRAIAEPTCEYDTIVANDNSVTTTNDISNAAITTSTYTATSRTETDMPVFVPKDSAGEALISQVPSENEMALVYSSEDNMEDNEQRSDQVRYQSTVL